MISRFFGSDSHSYLDARHSGKYQGRTACGSTISLQCDGRRNVPPRNLHGRRVVLRVCEMLEISSFQTNLHATANDANGGRDRSLLTYDALHGQSRLQVRGVGHAMAHYGSLERDDRSVVRESLLNLWVHINGRMTRQSLR